MSYKTSEANLEDNKNLTFSKEQNPSFLVIEVSAHKGSNEAKKEFVILYNEYDDRSARCPKWMFSNDDKENRYNVGLYDTISESDFKTPKFSSLKLEWKRLNKYHLQALEEYEKSAPGNKKTNIKETLKERGFSVTKKKEHIKETEVLKEYGEKFDVSEIRQLTAAISQSSLLISDCVMCLVDQITWLRKELKDVPKINTMAKTALIGAAAGLGVDVKKKSKKKSKPKPKIVNPLAVNYPLFKADVDGVREVILDKNTIGKSDIVDMQRALPSYTYMHCYLNDDKRSVMVFNQTAEVFEKNDYKTEEEETESVNSENYLVLVAQMKVNEKDKGICPMPDCNAKIKRSYAKRHAKKFHPELML